MRSLMNSQPTNPLYRIIDLHKAKSYAFAGAMLMDTELWIKMVWYALIENVGLRLKC
jgi:hypothetical protein